MIWLFYYFQNKSNVKVTLKTFQTQMLRQFWGALDQASYIFITFFFSKEQHHLMVKQYFILFYFIKLCFFRKLKLWFSGQELSMITDQITETSSLKSQRLWVIPKDNWVQSMQPQSAQQHIQKLIICSRSDQIWSRLGAIESSSFFF